MKLEQQTPNTISWVDLAASDLERQAAFYCELMGWRTEPQDDGEHLVFFHGGAPVGGALAVNPEAAAMPSVWSVHVAVDDAAATCALAAARGGTVFREPLEVRQGRVAVIGDPAGAALCVFDGQPGYRFAELDETGAPCWFESMSRDADAAATFYERLFGWTATPMEQAPMPYFTFGRDGVEQPIGGLMQLGDDAPDSVQSFWQVSFSIPTDIETFISSAQARGGRAVMGPMHTQFGSGAVITDPEGAFFVAFDRSTAAAL